MAVYCTVELSWPWPCISSGVSALRWFVPPSIVNHLVTPNPLPPVPPWPQTILVSTLFPTYKGLKEYLCEPQLGQLIAATNAINDGIRQVRARPACTPAHQLPRAAMLGWRSHMCLRTPLLLQVFAELSAGQDEAAGEGGAGGSAVRVVLFDADVVAREVAHDPGRFGYNTTLPCIEYSTTGGYLVRARQPHGTHTCLLCSQ